VICECSVSVIPIVNCERMTVYERLNDDDVEEEMVNDCYVVMMMHDLRLVEFLERMLVV